MATVFTKKFSSALLIYQDALRFPSFFWVNLEKATV
jgi:hypothetical protein